MLAFLRADYLKLFSKFNKIVKKEVLKCQLQNLYYKGVNGNARKFMEEMENSGTADAIRAEKGNLRYDYFIPAKSPETVLLIDSWENQEAIDVHHASPMMSNFGKTS